MFSHHLHVKCLCQVFFTSTNKQADVWGARCTHSHSQACWYLLIKDKLTWCWCSGLSPAPAGILSVSVVGGNQKIKYIRQLVIQPQWKKQHWYRHTAVILCIIYVPLKWDWGGKIRNQQPVMMSLANLVHISSHFLFLLCCLFMLRLDSTSGHCPQRRSVKYQS